MGYGTPTMRPITSIENLGRAALGGIENTGSAVLLAWDGIVNIFRPPFRWRVYLQQLEFIGVGSLVIVPIWLVVSLFRPPRA